MEDILFQISIWVLPALLAITLHEAAHGYSAWKLGDDTAYRLGRVSFNPLRHIDPFGTVLLPGLLLLSGAPFLFGYAKPVPVVFSRLRKPKRDMIIVAAAGPATNIFLAIIAIFMINFYGPQSTGINEWIFLNLRNALILNLILAVFNMLPIPPLDGGRVAVGLLPRPLAAPLARLERYGIFIVIGILFLLPFIAKKLGIKLEISKWLILKPVEYLLSILKTIFLF